MDNDRTPVEQSFSMTVEPNLSFTSTVNTCKCTNFAMTDLENLLQMNSHLIHTVHIVNMYF